MEVDQTYSIAYKGLKIGTHDFDFKVGPDFFEPWPEQEIKAGDCDVHVCLDRAETQLVCDVRITGHVVVACDRCLEDCSIPVDYEGRLLVRFSDELREYDGDVLWLSPVEDELDLKQYIYESIVLSLPYQRVHPEGECNPEMLERFRIVSGEEFAGIEARAGHAEGAIRADEMSKLEVLKARMTGGADEKER